jgi:hypothetical protein
MVWVSAALRSMIRPASLQWRLASGGDLEKREAWIEVVPWLLKLGLCCERQPAFDLFRLPGSHAPDDR